LEKEEIEELRDKVNKQNSIIYDQNQEIKKMNEEFEHRFKKLEKKMTVMKNSKIQEIKAQLSQDYQQQ